VHRRLIVAGILILAVVSGAAFLGKQHLGVGTTAAVPSKNVTLLTGSKLVAYLHQPYTVRLTANGGSPPYKWALTGGELPAGLSLNPSHAQINGKPKQGGEFSPTISASDAMGAVASKTFALHVFEQPVDQYHGLTNLPCSSGPETHFYTEKIGNRWHLCTPAGNAFWMNGVYHTDASDSGTDYQGIVLADVVNAKYASGLTGNSTLNWALQTTRRMQSWGFNTIAEYASIWTLPTSIHAEWGTADSTIPVKLPFVAFVAPSLYSLTNSGKYASGPVKDLIYGIKSSTYSGYRSSSPDVWDPNFAQWLQGELVNDPPIRQAYSGLHNDYLIGFTVDDTDNLQGFGAGPDFPTTANGVAAPGYNQVHLGWAVLVTAPAQSSSGSQTYANTTVYAKQELSNWLAARYNNDVASLDSAWGSNYSTFGSSGGFGVGSGFLDEDGKHSWVPKDANALSDANAAVKRDLDDFLLHHAQQYFSVIKNALRKAAPGVLYLGPTVLGTWGGVPFRQILQAAAPYVDAIGTPSIPSNCSNCTDMQQRIDFIAQYGGDKPWINWEGYPAQADSYMSPSANKGQTDQLQTQAARSQLYQDRMNAFLSAADSSTGTYHLVGQRWWELYDNRGESTNWGLLTRRDDPYDGISATTSLGADSWGYPTGCLPAFGCEQASYGDFLTGVMNANLIALRRIAGGDELRIRHVGPKALDKPICQRGPCGPGLGEQPGLASEATR